MLWRGLTGLGSHKLKVRLVTAFLPTVYLGLLLVLVAKACFISAFGPHPKAVFVYRYPCWTPVTSSLMEEILNTGIRQ